MKKIAISLFALFSLSSQADMFLTSYYACCCVGEGPSLSCHLEEIDFEGKCEKGTDVWRTGPTGSGDVPRLAKSCKAYVKPIKPDTLF